MFSEGGCKIKMFFDLRERTMAWDKILIGADQAQAVRTDMFICLPIATAAPILRLWYFTLKRLLAQYQFFNSRVKIDFFRKFYVDPPVLSIS